MVGVRAGAAWVPFMLMLLAPERAACYQEAHELDVKTYEKTTQPGSAWLLLFYAPWCGHCKKLAPVYEQVAEHYHRAIPQQVHVGRIDATAHPGLMTPFDIKGYPTILLLRDGKHLADFSGSRTFDALITFVDEALALPPGAPRLAASKESGNKERNARKAKRSKAGAAARYMQIRDGAIWLFTDADPFAAALGMLGVAIAMAACLVVALVTLTSASPR